MKYLPFELHCHTVHSDGKMTPELLAERIREEGLSGFALTDHNTVSGRKEIRQAAEKENLIVLTGIEWTTFFGHLTVIGENALVRDWRDASPVTIEGVLKDLRAAGNLVGMAHPYRIGYPICTGGSDDWGLNDYGGFTHYEVWSYLSPQKNDTNRKAEEKYRALAKKGERLAAAYGRDFHSPGAGAYGMTFLGLETENAQGAMEAVKSGRTYISTGVELNVACEQNGQNYQFGGDLAVGKVTLQADMRLWDAEYAKKYGVEPKKFTLSGTAIEKPVAWTGERISLELKAGYLMVTAEGNIEKEEGRLALCTPYYVREV